MKRALEFLILVSLVLCSCWDETDIITFSKDGTIKFDTQITVRDTLYTFDNIDKWVKSSVNEMINAKWDVQWEWINKKCPYQVKLTGKGNINDINDSTDYYSFKKIADNKYEWQFCKGAYQNDNESRIISISKSSVPLKTSDGKAVNSFATVSNMFGNIPEKYILDLN
jgi:hypothetical protein